MDPLLTSCFSLGVFGKYYYNNEQIRSGVGKLWPSDNNLVAHARTIIITIMQS